jgi:hypothetical protein
MPLHYDILDEGRRAMLPLLTPFGQLGYYLAGGTALALQIGHRDSIDFDFFCSEPFDTHTLFSHIENSLAGHTIVKMQEEKNTLEVLVDNGIRLSFMTYNYPLVTPVIQSDFFALASLTDIGCMKLSAITSRTAYKDYVDLYFIFHEITLKNLMEHLRTKLPTLDPLLALKSLVYFDDIYPEEILYKTEPVTLETIKTYLQQSVEDYNRDAQK